MITAITRKQPRAVAAVYGFVRPGPQMKAVELTSKQAKALAATAKTSVEHKKLAAYYGLEADKFEADAKRHEELAQIYRTSGGDTTIGGKNSGGGSLSRTFGHCDAVAKSLREAAKATRELAAEHEQMAKEPSK